jgi:proton-translocating NADH-quinone oxidoreductase chain L
MYILVLFLPFISFFILITMGNFIGKYGSVYIALSCLCLSLFFSILIFYEVGFLGYVCTIKLNQWMSSGILKIDWGLFYDSLTVTMLIVVLFISFLVHLYSISYMNNDPYIIRFISFLSLFTFFMLVLITSDNYVQLFLGWEGVGLCSYLLVNFWFTRELANKSAMKAVIVNRIGDFFLFLSLLLLFVCFKTFDFVKINILLFDFEFVTLNFFNYNLRSIDLLCFFIFGAAVGKSAQIGLHTWLPDAMEGPTPVSALIHAATMVTAGIFLVLRSSILFEFSQVNLNLITLFGTLTTILASTTGLFQYDIKKVIAYSTSSQLGYMFLACGTSNYNVAIFHLFNHAFFKALLFLGAGSVIHALNDEQDMRKMGGLFKILPFTFISMLIGTLALVGFPFLTGYYSKDLLIETLLYKYNMTFFFSCFLSCLVTFFTSFYSFRLLILTFMNKYKGPGIIFFKVHDCSFLMGLPLLILSILTLFIGFFMKDLMVGINTVFWQQSFIMLSDFNESSEFLNVYLKLIPFIGTFLGVFFSILVYQNFFFFKKKIFILHYKSFNLFLKNIYFFLGKKYLFDYIYNRYIVRLTFFLSYDTIFKNIDRGVIEFFGPTGLVRSLFFLSNQISILQSGFIYHYFIVKFLGFFVFGFFLGMFDFFYFDFFLYFFIFFFLLALYLLCII